MAGAFLPPSRIPDPRTRINKEFTQAQLDEMFLIIRDEINAIKTILNNKTTGAHELYEFISGSTYFSDPTLDSTTALTPIPRPEYLTTVNFGALPNTAAKAVAHGIITTAKMKMVHIHATASDLATPAYIQIPATWIAIDGTNITITTPADYTAYTECIVVLKYIKL